MTVTVQGIIQGNTIKLEHPLSLADGAQVEVVVRPVEKRTVRAWGDGIKASAGALADMPELDAIMDDIYQQRHIERRSQTE
jgi:hypothetical protein